MMWRLLVLAFSIMGSEAHANPGKWIVNQSKSGTDAAPEYSAALLSENRLNSSSGEPQQALLAVSCGRIGISSTIFWPTPFRVDPKVNATVVSWDMGDKKVNISLWDARAQATGLSGKEAKAFLHAVASGNKLVVRLSDDHGGQDAIFPVSGLMDIEATVLAMPCSL